MMAPGQASMVHGELGYGPLEIATLHGICSVESGFHSHEEVGWT
jgi:hypothetical protein